VNIGRRPLFFTALAVISLLLLEPTPADLRWVNLASAALAMFWAVALFLEERSLLRWRPGPADRSNMRNTKIDEDDPPTRA
jgi:hypothetical protein